MLAPSTPLTQNVPSWGCGMKRDRSRRTRSIADRCVSILGAGSQKLPRVTDRWFDFCFCCLRLHYEILEYTNYTKTTVSAMAVHIEAMIEDVRKCVRSLWPTSQVETFGSYSTGIWLPSSDVDLVILDVAEVCDNQDSTVKCLLKLAQALRQQRWVESLVVLETAKVPVIKLIRYVGLLLSSKIRDFCLKSDFCVNMFLFFRGKLW